MSTPPTGLKAALQQLTEFVKVAHDIGVGEVDLSAWNFPKEPTVSQETKHVT